MIIPLYVVIPSHDRAELAVRTLESLTRCIFPESYRETIVLENGSRSGSLEHFVAGVSAAYHVCYRHTGIANKSKALNEVVSNLPDDALIVFFDDDITIHPYTLVAYADAVRDHPEASHFGGGFMPDYADQPPPHWLRHYLPASALGWSLGPLQKVVHDGKFMGCNWAARQYQLLRAGLFDDSIGPGGQVVSRGEETAMQRALLQQDTVGVYVPNAIVWHYIPTERCSQEWTLATAYEQSKGRAYQLTKKVPSPSLMDRNVLFSALQTLSFPVFLMLLSPFISEHKAFWLKHRLQTALGYLAGAKLAVAETTKRH